jgi:hypothetical protein
MKTITLKEAYAMSRNRAYHSSKPVRTALVNHAFKVLPEVVEALDKASEWLNEMGCDHEAPEPSCIVCIVNKTLAKASKIILP